MKKILSISSIGIVLFGALLSAREINPMSPDFNHNTCLSSRSNSSTGNLSYLKQTALKSLAKMYAGNIEGQSAFSRLHPAHKSYYNKLRKSLRSDGQNLFSFELDKQLDLAGTCEDVEATLEDIINSLK